MPLTDPRRWQLSVDPVPWFVEVCQLIWLWHAHRSDYFKIQIDFHIRYYFYLEIYVS